MLLNLCQPGEYTDDLFAVSQPEDASKMMGYVATGQRAGES